MLGMEHKNVIPIFKHLIVVLKYLKKYRISQHKKWDGNRTEEVYRCIGRHNFNTTV